MRALARLHLFELHDQRWFPAVWRDLLNDYLSFFAGVFRPYARVAPLLAEALEASGTRRIVDLCSGGGAAVLSIRHGLDQSGVGDVTITLTDKYPNLAAWRRATGDGCGAVRFVSVPVDAADVPRDLDGFRTLFTSLHHFRPEQARAMLADAAARGVGIGAFEYTEQNMLRWGLPVLLIPLFVWATTPLMRPFSWRRLLWTYLVPVVPLVAMWDGLVSCLRSYSMEELETLVSSLPSNGLSWRVGRVRALGPARVTFVVGWPCGASGSRRRSVPGAADPVH